MTVSRIMTRDPITVTWNTPVTDAQALMRNNKFHRLPVLSRHGNLAGIISEKDLLYAAPSPATILNVYEMNELLNRLTVSEVMTEDVITISEHTLVEEAARIMIDNNIGGLPVMRQESLIGIITESDIFRIFIELFGTRREGMRVSLLVKEKKGVIADITGAIAQAGGNIVSLGTFPGEDQNSATVIMKLEEIEQKLLEDLLEPLDVQLLEIRHE
ncbi:CBS domain-containing protein [Spirochaeta dissipatitropha]